MFVIFQVFYSLEPPTGLGIRPVNDALASTSGQTGRKEEAWGDVAGTPRTPLRGLAGP
jgi:hypothetical protein